MKKLIPIVFMVLLLLSGCNQSKGLTQDELFEKKKECITYKNSLEKDIEKRTKNNNSEIIDYSETIEEIFYSEKENSCFAITDVFTQTTPIDGSKTIAHSANNIINLLTNERIYYDGDNASQIGLYYKRIDDLKDLSEK